MSLAAIVEALFDAGASREMIVAAVRAHEAAAATAAPEAKASPEDKRRARNRRYYERTKASEQRLIVAGDASEASEKDADVAVQTPVPPPLAPPSPSPTPQTTPPYNPPSGSSLRSDLAMLPGLLPASNLPAPIGKPKRAKSVKPPPAPPGEFDKWYDEYPRKVGKEEAIAAFDRAWSFLCSTVDFPGDILWNGLQRLKRQIERDRTEKKHIPHPATWLNGKRWTDEDDGNDDPNAGPPGGPNPRTGPRGWGDQRSDNLRSFLEPAAKARGFGE